jgi:hypothetical protein
MVSPLLTYIYFFNNLFLYNPPKYSLAQTSLFHHGSDLVGLTPDEIQSHVDQWNLQQLPGASSVLNISGIPLEGGMSEFLARGAKFCLPNSFHESPKTPKKTPKKTPPSTPPSDNPLTDNPLSDNPFSDSDSGDEDLPHK